MQANKQTCAKCQLPVAQAERLGSFTSFVFMDLHCQCHKNAKPALNAGKSKAVSNSCQTCGKVIPSVNRPGSITSFLLKDLRCNCPKSVKGSDDVLRTRYVPARATLTRKRQQLETAMRTRQANLTASDARLIDLKPGELIGGCYKLDYLVGKGGMGLIYKAKHETLKRTVALKFIAPSMVSKENWELFKKEAKISSSLSHNTICEIYDLGLHAGVLPFYAMDFIDGQTLEEIILSSGPLSVGATLEIFTRVAEGLSYAHRRSVVHKDIKPANIMVTNNEQGLQVKILDFGIAELNEGRKAQAETNVIYGSAAYMSPEQFRGLKLDQRADIYSLGCAMYETLTGMPPFQDETYEELCESHKRAEAPLLSDPTGIEFAVELEAIIQKCLQKHAEKRYQSANELAIDLQRLMDGKELQFARDQMINMQSPENLATKPNRKPQIFLLLATAGLVTITTSVSICLKILDHPPLKTKTESEIESESEVGGDISQDTIDKALMGEAKPIQLKDKKSPLNVIQLPQTPENSYFVNETTGKDKTKLLNYSFPFDIGVADLIVTDNDFGIFCVCKLDSEKHKYDSALTESYMSKVCYKKIQVPAKDFLTLKLRLSGMLTPRPDFVNGFRAKDIKGLDFSNLEEFSAILTDKCVKHFPDTERLLLHDAQENDTAVKLLSGLKHVKQLSLVNWYCSKNSVPYVSLFPELTTLYVSTKGSVESLLRFYLSSSPLKTIAIDNTTLSQADINYLANIKTLQSVSLRGCKFPKDYLRYLFTSKSIKTVHIWNDYFNPYEQNLQSINATSPLKELHFYSLKAPTLASHKMIESIKKRGIDCTWATTKMSSKNIVN